MNDLLTTTRAILAFAESGLIDIPDRRQWLARCDRAAELLADLERARLAALAGPTDESAHAAIESLCRAAADLAEWDQHAKADSIRAGITLPPDADLAEALAAERESLFHARRDAVIVAARAVEHLTSTKAEAPVIVRQRLCGWVDICGAIGLPTSKGRSVGRMSDLRGGPIKRGRKGQPPTVDRAALLSWWNTVDDDYRQRADRRRDAGETCRARHPHGRTGETIPELRGSAKPRRRAN